MNPDMTASFSSLKPRLGEGVYTLPDAALILRLPLSRLRAWVGGYLNVAGSPPPGILDTWGRGRQRAFNFHVLIEAYSVYTLRKLGVTMPRIRAAREILAERLSSAFPFASQGILAQGGKVLFDPGSDSPGGIIHLAPGQQTEFREIISPFCKELDFARETGLAERFWPLGRDSHIVIDPRVSFGRPVIVKTAITVESISSLAAGGEAAENIAAQFDIPLAAVLEADRFARPTVAA
jgi:uncharacterized protein (DUF433 family)